jgi:hypothetical protein
VDDHDVLLDDAERDLRGAEAALGRLDAGTYWTDEVTGAPLPDDVLAAQPTVRTLTVAASPAGTPPAAASSAPPQLTDAAEPSGPVWGEPG